jgi:hypothetical protein
VHAYETVMNTPDAQDLFVPIVSAGRLHPSFRQVASQAGYAPSRAMMQKVFSRWGQRDPNFVQQFQTDGFDARTWELYLLASFDSLGYTIDISHEQPDLLLTGRGVRWALEATTANPPAGGSQPVPEDPDARAEYLREELPIRLGSPLLSKLGKRYWERPHVAGLPLVFALQSFVTDDSLHYADNALCDLLFGVRTTGVRRGDATLEVISTPIETHSGSKTIPSNFFQQPDAEQISAVLWSNSGTVGKFGRMAFQQGLATAGLTMRRFGTRFVMDPNSSEPASFNYEVGDRQERWSEGLVLVHNPQAAIPLPYKVLPEAVHHVLEHGQVVSTLPTFHAFNSVTVTLVRK